MSKSYELRAHERAAKAAYDYYHENIARDYTDAWGDLHPMQQITWIELVRVTHKALYVDDARNPMDVQKYAQAYAAFVEPEDHIVLGDE